MSSPLSNLKNKKKVPLTQGSRIAPFKTTATIDDDFVNLLLSSNNSKMPPEPKNDVSNGQLMQSLMSRLCSVEKKLASSEELNEEKGKKIKMLEEKCEIFKKTRGIDHVLKLERKCLKLQNQIQSMENFLEDYGMIWVGNNSSSDNDEDDKEENILENEIEEAPLWEPDSSICQLSSDEFQMDFNLVLKNIQELNEIAGEGQHFIKRTKDGAHLEVQESVPLIFYENGIFMFGGPFRSYKEKTTQICMQDLMDGYFPSELQNTYPDGVPFKVTDKRDVVYRDKRMEKLFPGQGYSLSPEKNCNRDRYTDPIDDVSKRKELPNKKFETRVDAPTSSTENFLSKLPASVIRNGKIIDIRGDLQQTIKNKEQSTSHNVTVIETEVVKEIKSRLSTGRRSRPQTPNDVTTLRIKSESGNQTFVLKMRHSQTIGEVRCCLDTTRENIGAYDLKTSFPNETYADDSKTLRECGLTPNATMHMVTRKKET